MSAYLQKFHAEWREAYQRAVSDRKPWEIATADQQGAIGVALAKVARLDLNDPKLVKAITRLCVVLMGAHMDSVKKGASMEQAGAGTAGLVAALMEYLAQRERTQQ